MQRSLATAAPSVPVANPSNGSLQYNSFQLWHRHVSPSYGTLTLNVMLLLLQHWLLARHWVATFNRMPEYLLRPNHVFVGLSDGVVCVRSRVWVERFFESPSGSWKNARPLDAGSWCWVFWRWWRGQLRCAWQLRSRLVRRASWTRKREKRLKPAGIESNFDEFRTEFSIV